MISQYKPVPTRAANHGRFITWYFDEAQPSHAEKQHAREPGDLCGRAISDSRPTATTIQTIRELGVGRCGRIAIEVPEGFQREPLTLVFGYLEY
jgi:hypothetical protein